jgi:hypothetical protein
MAQAPWAMDEVTSLHAANAALTDTVTQLEQQLIEAQAQASRGNALDTAAIQALAAALEVGATSGS